MLLLLLLLLLWLLPLLVAAAAVVRCALTVVFAFLGSMLFVCFLYAI